MNRIIGDIIRASVAYEADMIVFVPESVEEVDLSTPALIVQHGAYGDEDVRGHRYLLEIGIIREVIDGLQRQLGTPPTPPQSLKAVLYYAEHDAFPKLDVVK